MQQQRDAGRGDFIGARTLQHDVPVARQFLMPLLKLLQVNRPRPRQEERPKEQEVFLVGSFNDWNVGNLPLQRAKAVLEQAKANEG